MKSLKHRLARAKNWSNLQKHFSPAILAWMPADGAWAGINTEYRPLRHYLRLLLIPIARVERTPKAFFDQWLALLVDERGLFLSKLSSQTQHLYELLTRAASSCTTPLEAVTSLMVEACEPDSDALLRLCSCAC